MLPEISGFFAKQIGGVQGAVGSSICTGSRQKFIHAAPFKELLILTRVQELLIYF
jgi:hypothetical protein